MAYIKPQVIVFQEFTTAPTEVTDPMRALIVGGNAKLHRYAVADEKALIGVGSYDRTQDVCYEWPEREAGSEVDEDYVKLFVDDALLLYYEDLIDAKTEITPVSGRLNWIKSDNLGFKTNTAAYPRSAVFKDRDVKVGDVVYLRSVYDPEDTCEEIELWTSVKGFAAEATDSSVGDASTDAANADDQTANTEIEQVDGPENCVTATADGSEYTGLASGYVEEEYTIEVVESAVSGCNAARLRVTSASGTDDQDEVVPEDFGEATAIGTRGLTVTFANTSGEDCESEASLADVAPTDFAIGQKWVVTVRQEFEKVLALSGGDYTGTVNDTYVVEVVKGGLWEDLPAIKVTTVKGLDYSGPTEVTDANIAIPIGRNGVTIKFFGSEGGDADLSIGADDVAGLRKGDKFYITVNAAGTGRVSRLILKHDLPVKMRSATDIDLRLFIKANVEVSKNRIGSAPLTNYYTEETQICVQEGAEAFYSEWTEDGVELPLPIYGGELYVEYREWLDETTDKIRSLNDPAGIDVIPGQLSVDNPLKYGVSKALANSGGTAVQYLGVEDPTDIDSWQKALKKAIGRRDLYNYVPLTFDKEILDLFAAQATTESGPTKTNWKACFFSLKRKTSRTLVSADTSSDGEIVLATLSDNPQATGSQYTLLSVPDGNADFETNEVDAGDTVRFLYTTDGFGNESWSEFVVDEVLSENSLIVKTGHTSAVSVAQKIEIVRALSSEEVKEDLVAQAGAFADSRVCAVYPDLVGNGGTSIPGYHLAAALAGLVSGALPHQPLTNVAISGFDDVTASSIYFDETQLDNLSEAGVWVVTADADGVIHTRDAVTTDTSSLKLRMESVRRNVDAISFLFTSRLKRFIGRTNVTPNMLLRLKQEADAALDYLTRSGDVEELGPQLISGQVTRLRVHQLLEDRIEIVLSLQVPLVLNNIELHLVV